MGVQAEERGRKGARRSKVVAGTNKVVKVGVKVVKVASEGAAANGASEEGGVSTTHRRKKTFYDYRG